MLGEGEFGFVEFEGAVDEEADARETAIGWLPAPADLETSGLGMDAADLEALLEVDAVAWSREVPQLADHSARFGDRLPAELAAQLDRLSERLDAS